MKPFPSAAIGHQSCALGCRRLWRTSTCCCLGDPATWPGSAHTAFCVCCNLSSFHGAWGLAKVHLKKGMKNLPHLGLDSLCLLQTEESEAKQEKTKGLPGQKGQGPGGGFIEAVSTPLADGYGRREVGERGLNEAVSHDWSTAKGLENPVHQESFRAPQKKCDCSFL